VDFPAWWGKCPSNLVHLLDPLVSGGNISWLTVKSAWIMIRDSSLSVSCLKRYLFSSDNKNNVHSLYKILKAMDKKKIYHLNYQNIIGYHFGSIFSFHFFLV
jgi:hypothetical protein